MLKKFLILISICLLIIFASLPFSAAAKGLTINKGIITIETVSANCGDTVVVAIKIDENPGFAAYSVSVNYDSSVLEFKRHISGNVIDCESKAHPQKNIIRLVGGIKGSGDRKGNGTIVNLEFKIADKAPAGFSKLDITYTNGDFSNWDLDKVMPTIISGGVNVNLSEKNCPHNKYSNWQVKISATCNEIGIEQRFCKDCNHLESREIDITEHNFEDNYTVDKIATKEESGRLSIHCKNCTAVTNELSFSIKHAEKGKYKNDLGESVANTDYIKQLLKEQYPDSDPTVSNPETNKTPNNPNSEIDNPIESEPDSQSSETENKPTDTNTETDNNGEVSVIEKIEESFPQTNQILKYFKIFVIIVIVIIVL